MENLKLEKTKDSLGINFNSETGILEMYGNSYPENATQFFNQIYKWIEEYINNIGKRIVVECKVDYFNTSTSKCFLELIDILEKYSKSGGDVNVNWYFKKGDIDTEEAGEELLEDYEVEYQIIEY